MNRFDIRLVGGPFDGDKGLITKLPGIIWAWQCQGRSCRSTGHCRRDSRDIHWSVVDAAHHDTARRLGMTSYRRDTLTAEGWWRFIYADGLACPIGQDLAQRLIREKAA
jgi:hypothetical protein